MIMAVRLYSEFKKFHDCIKIDYESDVLKEKSDILKEDFRKNFPKELENYGIEVNTSDIDFFDQGSYRHQVSTTIKTDNVDRDLAVSFPLDITKEENKDPRRIKKSAKKSLEILNTRKPVIKEPCITVEYSKQEEAYIHIDFPIYAIHQDQYYLARGKEYSENPCWEKSDPKGLNELFDCWFKDEQGNQFRRIVRYLKKWKNENYPVSTSKDQVPPGIGLTILGHKGFYFTQENNQDNDLKCLKEVVATMLESFSTYLDDNYELKHQISLELPTEPYTNIFFKLTENGQENFYNRLLKFNEKLEEAIDKIEDYESAKILRKIFGEDFPLPPEPKTSDSRPTKENGYA